MKNTSLIVFSHIEGEFFPAGRLTLIEQENKVMASNFVYGTRYLKRPNTIELDPLGLSLVDKEHMQGKVLIPPNQLSFFGGIRDASPDAWGRRVIEAFHQVPANSLPESTYLLEAGQNRVGALDIRQKIGSPASCHKIDIHDLSYLIEAAERIETGKKIPKKLEGIFFAGSGLGGMRPKASVRDEHKILWLAKFSSASDRLLNVPMIEHAALRLAKVTGLNVPEIRYLSIQEKNVLLIQRFDRFLLKISKKSTEYRKHFISALTLLGCEEMDSPNKSYMDIADAIRRYCAAVTIKSDIQELYARMIFNIFISNDDDHLRNHGFLLDKSVNGWRLSPLYDVMPHAGIASERYLHLGVGPKGRLADLDNAYAAKERFGLLKDEALDIISRIWSVVRQWKVHFESFGVPDQQLNLIQGAFRHIDEISSPTLRKLLG